MATIKAFFVSNWDDGHEIKTICDFDPETKVVSNIEQEEDVKELDILNEEYVELFDGTVIEDYINPDND